MRIVLHRKLGALETATGAVRPSDAGSTPRAAGQGGSRPSRARAGGGKPQPSRAAGRHGHGFRVAGAGARGQRGAAEAGRGLAGGRLGRAALAAGAPGLRRSSLPPRPTAAPHHAAQRCSPSPSPPASTGPDRTRTWPVPRLQPFSPWSRTAGHRGRARSRPGAPERGRRRGRRRPADFVPAGVRRRGRGRQRHAAAASVVRGAAGARQGAPLRPGLLTAFAPARSRCRAAAASVTSACARTSARSSELDGG
jgi:hypothetical protein